MNRIKLLNVSFFFIVIELQSQIFLLLFILKREEFKMHNRECHFTPRQKSFIIDFYMNVILHNRDVKKRLDVVQIILVFVKA